MNQLTAIMFLVGIIIVALVSGLFLGIYYQGQQSGVAQQGENSAFAVMPALIGNLNSSIFLPITAHGSVVKTNGNKITLNNGSEDFLINMGNDADFSKIISDPSKIGSYTSSEIKFSDIKVGDVADVYVKVLQNGQLQGTSILIYPASK